MLLVFTCGYDKIVFVGRQVEVLNMQVSVGQTRGFAIAVFLLLSIAIPA